MRIRTLMKAAFLGAFLLSAFNYCPPGAEAAQQRQAMDCCRKTPAKGCPAHSKRERMVSCCTAERLTSSQVQARVVHAARALPVYAASTIAAPQVLPHRVARQLIRPAGPPGLAVVAAVGNRAPPLS